MQTGAEGNIQAYSAQRRGAADALRGVYGDLWQRGFQRQVDEANRAQRDAERARKYQVLATLFGGAGTIGALSAFGGQQAPPVVPGAPLNLAASQSMGAPGAYRNYGR